MNETLIKLIRETYPSKIANELVSVQPINITPEDWSLACEVIAAMHNHNHPDDQWPTSLVMVPKDDADKDRTDA